MTKDVFCENCGKKMEGVTRFCSQCGAESENVGLPQADALKEVAGSKEKTKKEKHKKGFIILILTVFVIIFAGIIGISIYNSPDKRLAKQLDLGNRYLEEMDYEQAILAYKAAIEIDSKCQDAYLGLADIYIIQEEQISAAEILEEGYTQTESEIILAKLRGVFSQFPEEDYSHIKAEVVLTQLNEILAQISETENVKETEKQADVVLGDVFVQFVNAPFTDENGLGDGLASADVAREYARSCGYVMGSDEYISIGDKYFYYSDYEAYDKDSEDMAIINCSYLVISTKGNIDTSYVGAAGDASYTSYSYEEGKGEEVRTSLGNSDQLKKESMPAIGGFSNFLMEHNCFSMESIVEVIGLNDEKISEAVRGNFPIYTTQVETPYGVANIRIENYSNEWATGGYLQLKLLEESDAPFSIIYIEEGTYYSLYEDSWGNCLDIEAVFTPD